MDKIIIKNLNIGTSTNADGCALKFALIPYFENGNSVYVSFEGATPMSSSFFNSSFAELIDSYGYEKFKKTVAVTDITKSHFELIQKYIMWKNSFVTT